MALAKLFKSSATNKDQLDLLNDPIKKLVYRLSGPLMLSGLVTTSYGFVDMIFASRLGSVEVAAIAFIMPLFAVIQALTVGVIRGGVSIIATHIGKGERPAASAYATQLRWLMVVLSIAVTLTFALLLPIVLTLADVPQALKEQSLLYATFMYLSIPFMLLSQLYMSFFNSQGKMKVISRVSIFSVLCNALLNYVFISFTDLGIQGLALAGLISVLIELSIILTIYHRGEQSFDLAWRSDKDFPVLSLWRQLLKVGFPLSISQASTHFGFLLLNIIIVQFGHHAVAAFAIGNRINSLLFASTKQISNALVPLIAQNWGKGNIERVKQSIRFGLLYSVIVGVLAAFVIHFIKVPLASYFANGDTVTYGHIVDFVGLVGWTVIAWVIFHTFHGVFTALQKTLFSMTIEIVRLWCIRIPGVLIFFYWVPSVAEYGIWYTMFISNVVTAVFAALYYLRIVPMLMKEREIEMAIESEQGLSVTA